MNRTPEPTLHVQTAKQARFERFLMSPADDRDTIVQHYLQSFKTPGLAAVIGDVIGDSLYREMDPIGTYDRMLDEVQRLARNLKLVRARYDKWVDPLD